MSKYSSIELFRFLLQDFFVCFSAKLDKGVIDHVHFLGFKAKEALSQGFLDLNGIFSMSAESGLETYLESVG